MVRQVPETPGLPGPPRGLPVAITTWAGDLIRVLFGILAESNIRLNRVLPKDGTEAMQQPLPLASFTLATRPTASEWTGAVIFVSDAPAGQKLQTSNGSTWVAASGGISALVDDLTPQLGGDLDLNSKNIDFPSTADISDCLDEDTLVSDSATALATQQSIKAYVDNTTGMGSLLEDLTPQLGGDLDLNAKNIDFPSTPNVSDVLDEDNMVSDSATMLATQQSIKAYVDSAIGPGWENVIIDHGAAGDGVADDAPELQAAIDAAEAGSGLVFAPAGTFLLNARVNVSSNVKIFGVPGATIFKNGLAASNPDGIMEINAAAKNIVLEDLIFDGDGQAISTSGNAGLLRMKTGGEDIYVNRCTFKTTVSNGISIFNSGVSVTACKFIALDLDGIRADVEGFPVRIHNNRFSDIGELGILITGVNTPPKRVEVVISNNVFKDMNDLPIGAGQFGNAISVFFVQNVVIMGNQIFDCEWGGIRVVKATYAAVVGNTVDKTSQVGTGAAIWLELEGNEGSVVIGNTIQDFERGIICTNFSADPPGHAAVISGNSLFDGSGTGIKVEGDCIVSNNLVNGALTGLLAGTNQFTRDLVLANNLILDTRAASAFDVVVNGTFASDASWDKGTGWTISGGTASKAAGTGSDLDQNTILAAGETHRIIYTVSGRTAGTITAKCGSGGAGTARSTNATFTEDLLCSGSTDLIFTADSSFDGDIDNVIAFKITKDAIEISSHASAGDVAVMGNMSKGIAGKPYVGSGGGALGDNIFFSGNFNPIPTADRPTAALGGSIHYDSTTGLMNYYDDSAGAWRTF